MSDVWKNIVVAVVSFLLAIIGQQYFFNKQNEIQKIDVHTNFDSNYLSKPKFPDSKVEIKVDGNTKESIGILEVSLVNFSNQTFKDVPIIIEITPRRGDSFSYLSHFAHGEKGMRDLVEIAKPYEFINGTHRFFYTVKSLNRSEEANIGMKLGILFEGEQEPEVTVSAVGLNTRDFDMAHSPARSKVQRDALLIIIVFIVGLFAFTFAIFSPIMSRLMSPLDLKSNKKYARQIFDILRAESYYSSMSDNDLKNHVSDILYKRQYNWWNEKSWLGKWSLGMRAPEPSDYRI